MSSRGHILQNEVGAIIGSPDMELIEEYTVTGSAVTTYDMTSTLDGNSDGGYLFVGYIENEATTAPTYTIRLNGASIACNRASMIQSGAGTTGAVDTTTTILGLQATSGTIYRGQFEFFLPYPMTGQERVAHGKATHNGNTTSSVENSTYIYKITTPSTATNITSIGLSSSQTNGIGVGSKFKLFKLTNY